MVLMLRKLLFFKRKYARARDSVWFCRRSKTKREIFCFLARSLSRSLSLSFSLLLLLLYTEDLTLRFKSSTSIFERFFSREELLLLSQQRKIHSSSLLREKEPIYFYNDEREKIIPDSRKKKKKKKEDESYMSPLLFLFHGQDIFGLVDSPNTLFSFTCLRPKIEREKEKKKKEKKISQHTLSLSLRGCVDDEL